MVSITKKAAIELQNILKKEDKQGGCLRIFMAGFGCSGPQYGLALEEKAASKDKVTESNGIKIFLDENMDALLSGAGFVINNVAATNGSGCNTCGGCD